MPWNKDGSRKEKGTFYMKYQGNSSAFPFKSPLKHPHRTWKEALSHDKDQPHSPITPEVEKPKTEEKTNKKEVVKPKKGGVNPKEKVKVKKKTVEKKWWQF